MKVVTMILSRYNLKGNLFSLLVNYFFCTETELGFGLHQVEICKHIDTRHYEYYDS